MEVTPHISTEFFCKEPINIFDEIEKLLSGNEIIQTHQWDAEIFKSKDGDLFNGDNLIQTISYAGVDGTNELYFPNRLEPPPLVPIDSNKPKPSRLFVVANGGLQPIHSHMKSSGIFKKMDTMPNGCDMKHHRVANVISSGAEPNGRVLSKKDFIKLYVNTAEESEDKIEIFAKSTPKIIKTTDGKSGNSTLYSNDENGQLDNSWDPLSKLAYNMFQLSNHDHIVIDRKRNEIVRTESGTNQKIIYRFLSPQAVQMDLKPTVDASNVGPKRKHKVGRPRKNRENLEQKRAKSGSESDTNLITKPPPKEEKYTLKETRTRSGRIAKTIHPSLSIESSELDATDSLENPALYFRSVIDDLKDTDYEGKKSMQTKEDKTTPIQKEKREEEPHFKFSTRISTKNPNTKRRIPPNSICPTCHKIFLGRRLQRHFIKHPDHMKTVPNENTNDLTKQSQQSTNLNNPPVEDMTLFSFLVSKLQKSNLNEDQKADLFLHEINDFVEQLQARSSRLIRNTSGLHFVTARSARVLGIPEGQYALDMSAVEEPHPELEPEPAGMNGFENAGTMPVPSIHNRSLDYTAISMDDTLTDEAVQKLNLSAGGKLLPPSEETLLRVVDDLVQGNIANLDAPNLLIQPENNTPATNVETLVPNYEHANDNAVEAVSMKVTPTHVAQQTTPLLDLSVDFFQFKKN